MKLNYKKFNPLGFYLLMLLQDITLRFIILYGGSSSGKSFSVAQIILIFTIWEGSNTLVMRKVGSTIKDTIYQSFKKAAEWLNITSYFRFSDGNKVITCVLNGARIVFKGLDDSEKIKGIESFKRVVMEESNEFEEGDHKQVRKRLRGMVGQQIIQMFNPVDEEHWIKKKLFDTEKWHDIPMEVVLKGEKIPAELTEVKSIKKNEPKVIINPRTKEIEEHAPDTIAIQTTYLHNFWVVGSPDGTYGYYDQQTIADFERDRLHDPDFYNVYALGEWGVIRTGSEFFSSFNRGKHSTQIEYDPNIPIHISIDNNVIPYITTTFWQVSTESGTQIRQFDEVLAESPNNTVRKAAKLVADKLKSYLRQNVTRQSGNLQSSEVKVFIHGDASTKSSNTIDEEKRSFLDLFIDTLQKEGIEIVDCVGNKNPSVSMSGEFINAIFDKVLPGLEIIIGDKCSISIGDYMSVQKDVNGAILKTKIKNKTTMQTYEKHGHISDTFRYLVVDVLKEEFFSFSMKRKRNLYARDGAIHFYNPKTECKYSRDILYTMPNVNGKFVLVHGKMCGDKWHIVSLRIKDTSSTDEIREILMMEECSQVIMECGQAYFKFARDLRKDIPGLRVMKEVTDIDRRIAATSDFVKNHLLFNEEKLNEIPEYSVFMANLLDYNKDSANKEASAVLSGFIQFVIKFDFPKEDIATINKTNN